MTSIYHQKQYKNFCRLHAINNLLGSCVFSFNEFNKYCDDFDKKNNFKIGFSKNSYAFYNNGENDNIFGYILEQKLLKSQKLKLEFINKNNLNISYDFIGFICFNNNHTWCIKIINNKLYLIDSLKANPIEINFNYFKKNLYFIKVIINDAN